MTNRQIILGKYLALAAFGLAMVAVLSVFGLYTMAALDAVEIPVILNGFLGIYLLICAYAAIGLFMSSLTSYSVVAAMGTLGVLAMLNYVGSVGQEIEFVRDITYWVSISGRAESFLVGLITSEDLLYFLIVTGLFLSFSIIKLQSGRQRTSAWIIAAKYTCVFILAMGLGFVSSRPALKKYVDVTKTQINTLSKNSQDVMRKLKQPITITTYNNLLNTQSFYELALPAGYKRDVNRFEQYARFKPDLKFNHVYYYHKGNNHDLDIRFPGVTDKLRIDTLKEANKWNFDIIPYSDISKQVNLANEEFRFVRELVQADGRKTFLRVFDDPNLLPNESQITAAFKRLAGDLPRVGFLTGQDERSSNSNKDDGYKEFAQEKSFRFSLINNGFEFEDVVLDKPVPENIHILVIAEMKKALTGTQRTHLDQYLQRGDNLLIAGEPGRQAYMNTLTEPLGVHFRDGQLVRLSENYQPNLILADVQPEAVPFSYYMEYLIQDPKRKLPMLSTSALELIGDKGYTATTLFRSDSATWNELQTTDFKNDSARFDADETKASYATVVALTKQTNHKEQKILVTGDADWLSNAELGLSRSGIRSASDMLVSAAFFWLSNGEGPTDVRHELSPDNKLTITKKEWRASRGLLKWGVAGILLVFGLLIWIRRRGR